MWFIDGCAWYAGTSLKRMATSLQHSSGMAIKDSSHKGQALGPYIQFPTSCGMKDNLRNESTLINGEGLKQLLAGQDFERKKKKKIAER